MDCSTGRVKWVWRQSDGVWEDVLVCTEDPNVFMVLVLDLESQAVRGHRLLDLDAHYDLGAPTEWVGTALCAGES